MQHEAEEMISITETKDNIHLIWVLRIYKTSRVSPNESCGIYQIQSDLRSTFQQYPPKYSKVGKRNNLRPTLEPATNLRNPGLRAETPPLALELFTRFPIDRAKYQNSARYGVEPKPNPLGL